MTDVLMPSLGENVKEGIVISVLVKEGDTIENGQTLIEVETDKVTFEVPAEGSGKVTGIFVNTGDIIEPGKLLIKLSAEIPKARETTPAKPPTEVLHAASHNAAADPQLVHTFVPEQREAYADAKNGATSAKETKKYLSTPLARKLARELDIEISEVGAAINRRITFNDVKVFTKDRLHQLTNKKLQKPSDVVTPPLPNFEKFGSVRRQDMASIMVATSRNMTVSADNIPHAWVQEKIDITNLEAHRKKHKSKVQEEGGNLTITALVIKAVAKALQVFPILNSSLDVEMNRIIFKDYFHIGVAVDTPRGLLVPVIRDVEKRSLTNISIELTRISKEVKEGKAKLEDLEGATFTISNLGGIGTTGMNPIVNWPQAAILGLSASQIEPVWIENNFVPRLRIPLTLGFDHRVIKGAEAARFLQHLKNLLEDPFLLLL